MLIALVVLAGLSLLALIIGAGWTLMTSGQTDVQSGPEVGAEIIAERMYDEDEDDHVVAQRAHFRGKAVKVERRASVDLSEIKERLAEGQWRGVFPPLLALAGFLSLLVFGSLAVGAALENKMVAALILVAATYALIRIVLALVRA